MKLHPLAIFTFKKHKRQQIHKKQVFRLCVSVNIFCEHFRWLIIFTVEFVQKDTSSSTTYLLILTKVIEHPRTYFRFYACFMRANSCALLSYFKTSNFRTLLCTYIYVYMLFSFVRMCVTS